MEVSKVPFRGCNCQNCDTARKLVAPEGIPDEVVGLISKHDSLVSKALATNTNLSLDIYLLLAEGTDASGEVRKSLAENPSVPLKGFGENRWAEGGSNVFIFWETSSGKVGQYRQEPLISWTLRGCR